jgi:hypothetical protein
MCIYTIYTCTDINIYKYVYTYTYKYLPPVTFVGSPIASLVRPPWDDEGTATGVFSFRKIAGALWQLIYKEEIHIYVYLSIYVCIYMHE